MSNVVSETTINIRGVEYRQFVYDDDSTVLKRYEEKAKMWITSRFINDCDESAVQSIVNTAIRVM